MSTMEQVELDAHRGQLISDVKHLVEKYRSIFAWDVPDRSTPETFTRTGGAGSTRGETPDGQDDANGRGRP